MRDDVLKKGGQALTFYITMCLDETPMHCVVVDPDATWGLPEVGAAAGSLQLAVQQSNFHDYPVMKMSEIPPIEVHLVPSTSAPTGVGETSLPPIAAAVANAIHAATGTRLRRLPFAQDGFESWRTGRA